MKHSSKKQEKSNKSSKKIENGDIPEVTKTNKEVTDSTPQTEPSKISPAPRLRILYNGITLPGCTQEELDIEKKLYQEEKKKYNGKFKSFLNTLPNEHPLIQIISKKWSYLVNQWIVYRIPVGGNKSDDIQIIDDLRQLSMDDLTKILRVLKDGTKILWDFTNRDSGLNQYFSEMMDVPTTNGSVIGGFMDFKKFLTGYENKILNHPTILVTENNIYNIFKEMCRMSLGTTPVGNFPSKIGMFIIMESFYETILRYGCIPNDNFVILDPCSGWGGRLLSTLCIFNRVREEYMKRVGRQLHVTYLSTDTNEGVHERFNNIKLDWFEIIKPEDNSEYFHFKKETLGCETPEFLNYCKTVLSNFGLSGVNVSLTSPPYFDREKYSKDKAQSNLMYPTYPVWRIKFLKGMIDNVHELLIPGGKFYLNIANTYEPDGTLNPLEQDTVTFFTELEMKPVRHYKMLLSGSSKSVNYIRKGINHKFEPIFVYEK
jgi:hypothetical protein